jgi:RNA polymerase sigma-70 factor (ECF subfamily)
MAPSLLELAQDGDGDAFAQLVDPYRSELHRYCYRMLGSLTDADDLCQETMLSAWRAIGGFCGRSSLRTWLYRIATNRCLNAIRDQKMTCGDLPGSAAILRQSSP